MIPVANPLLGEEEAKAVYDVVKSGRISMGKEVESFEKEFKTCVRARNAIAVNNCTAALHACLVAMGIKEGDEVIIPSLTFISTANVVLFEKAKPILAECDPRTYNITTENIGKLITKRTKAIIPVDMNGMPVDYEPILELAEKHSIPIILDSAESLGAEYKKRKVGSIAPVHCFSFYPNKNITTGEGGMITTNDDEFAEKIRIIINQGQEGRYHHTTLGYNYRMTDVLAAIGRAQLKKLEFALKEKADIVERYNHAFADCKGVEVPFVPDYVTRHAWYMYAISVKKEKRDSIVQKLSAAGIETRLSFPPIHTQPLYQKLFGFKNETLPITYDAWCKLIDIPIWVGLSKEDQDSIVSTIKRQL